MIAVCSGQDNCPSSHECSPTVVGQSTINRCCPTRGDLLSRTSLSGVQSDEGLNAVPDPVYSISEQVMNAELQL